MDPGDSSTCPHRCVLLHFVAILANRIGSIHASGFLAFLDDFLYLPEVLHVIILFWLLFSGPGPYSVDSTMARQGGLARVDRPLGCRESGMELYTFSGS
jgi:hypothetical protein